MGLCTAADRAGPAFIAAVLSTRMHHTLANEEFMHALRPFCVGAYDSLESSLADVSVKQCRQITKIIPCDAILLTTLSQNALRQSSQNKIKKLLHIQGAVVNEIYRRKRIFLRGTAVVSREAAKNLPDLVKADFSRLLLVTSRSQFSRIFTCSLFRFENRMDIEPFVRVVRWYFGRSQPVPEHATLGREVGLHGIEADLAVCPCHDDSVMVLDNSALHQTACASTFGSRVCDCHNPIRDTLATFTRMTDGTAMTEPHTRTVLLDQFDSDVLRVAFPRSTSGAAGLLSGRILDLISSLHTVAAHRRPEISAQIMAIANSAPARQKGRTLDVLSTFPASNRAADLWMDVRVTHSTQRTLLDKTYKFCCDVYHAEAKAGGDHARSGMLQEMSPAVTNSVKEKERAYEPMMKLARDQVKNKSRRVLPALMACVISHEGEFSRPLVRTIETLTQHYRNLIKAKPHLFETGEKLGKKTSTFRASLKDALMCANANGFGKALACAGKPNTMFFRAANFPGPLAPSVQLPSTPVQSLNATMSDIVVRNSAYHDDNMHSMLSPTATPFSPRTAPGAALPLSQ